MERTFNRTNNDVIVQTNNPWFDLECKKMKKELRKNLNTEKTKTVIFKKEINQTLYQEFKIDGKSIEIVDKFKFLGATM
jgi:hypothetical protein